MGELDDILAKAGAAPAVAATPPTVAATTLPPDVEPKYQQWRATLPQRLQSEGDYDLRGFYQNNPTFSVDKPGQHMTDEFKLPNHETFSDESKYYNDKTKAFGGSWKPRNGGGFSYIPNDPTKKQRIDEDENGNRVVDEPPPSWLKKTPPASDLDAILAKAQPPEPEAEKSPAQLRQINNTGPYDQVRASLQAPPDAPPSALESGVSHALQGATFGFNDELTGAVNAGLSHLPGAGPSVSYQQARDTLRARLAAQEQAHPVVSGLSELAGGLVTPMGEAATAVDAAKLGAGYGALGGAGYSDADLTKGQVGQFANDVGTGAAVGGVTSGVTANMVRGAPERVDDRILSGISRGEAGGAAKDKLYKRVIARAGEGGENLADAVGEGTPLEQALAVRSKSNPAAVEKMVTKRIDELTPQTEPYYEAIDSKMAGRGVDLRDFVEARLSAGQRTAVEDGRAVTATAYEKALGQFQKLYGDGKAPLSARSLRNYANEVGEGIFDNTVDPTKRVRAQQALYRDVTGAIEDAGEEAGVNVSGLRDLNRKISTLIPVRDALADRGIKAAAGRTSLFQNLLSAGAITAGGAHGGISGAITGAVGAAALKGALPSGRLADYQLARLVKAARAGSPIAQTVQTAIEMGLSRTAAEALARRIGPSDETEQQP